MGLSGSVAALGTEVVQLPETGGEVTEVRKTGQAVVKKNNIP